jgi:predicted dienelactone hydrolase
MASSGGRFPLILYSHGYLNDRGSCSEKGPYLASHGYVVIAIDHADATTVFPDGSYFTGVDTGLDTTLQQDRLRDWTFALEELERWSVDDPILAGRLDLDKVAVIGFSFGGATAGELARADDRCQAAVLLDAGPFNGAELVEQRGIQKPLLQINASSNSSDLVYARNNRDALFFQISSSSHLTMGGEDYFWTQDTGTQLAASREAARTVNACILAFINRYLKDLDDPLLDAQPAEFPRIINWKQK